MPSAVARFPDLRLAAALLALAVLSGCASAPKPGPGGAAPPSRPVARPTPDRDGVEATPPSIDLTRVPDAQPQVEPIRPGGPNKPYAAAGQTFTPIAEDRPYGETGLASWYGRKFQGRRTASGEVYNMYAMTAAHPTLPIPSYARVRNPANGREVVVRVNDRGPFVKGRIIDLSYAAAIRLEVQNGVAPVEVQRITFEEIRTGAWRRDAGGSTVAEVPASNVVPVVATTIDPAPAAEAAAASAPPVVADAPTARAYTTPARGFWVQLGAFRQREGAESFHRRVIAEMDWLGPLLAVFSDAAMYRLQAGPYPSREEARNAAERVRDGLKLVPVIVERR